MPAGGSSSKLAIMLLYSAHATTPFRACTRRNASAPDIDISPSAVGARLSRATRATWIIIQLFSYSCETGLPYTRAVGLTHDCDQVRRPLAESRASSKRRRGRPGRWRQTIESSPILLLMWPLVTAQNLTHARHRSRKGYITSVQPRPQTFSEMLYLVPGIEASMHRPRKLPCFISIGPMIRRLPCSRPARAEKRAARLLHRYV